MSKTDNSIRILSYNIHKGFSLGNRRFVLQKIRDALATVKPHVMFLQEVVGEHEKHSKRIADWPVISQVDFLASEKFRYCIYGKNAEYKLGHHGNALLSVYPIRSWSNTDISTNRLECRGMLHAVLDVPGMSRPLHCVCVHLDLLRRGRTTQITRICDEMKPLVGLDNPLILAGDFNDWTRKASHLLEEQLGLHETHYRIHGKYGHTFPSRFPVLQLDRVYFRGVTPISAEVLCGKPWSALSDHAAVVSEYSW